MSCEKIKHIYSDVLSVGRKTDLFWYRRAAYIFYRSIVIRTLCSLPLQGIAQSETIVHLERMVFEDNYLTQDMIEAGRKNGLQIGEHFILAGDFSDSVSRFTIALCDMNRNKQINDPNEDIFSINRYKADSVHIWLSVSSQRIPSNNRPIILLAGRQKYSADLSRLGENIVIIKKVKKNSVQYDVKLFDHLPDISFQLLNQNGVFSSFQNYTNQKKLIYVNFWCLHQQQLHYLSEEMEELKELKKMYPQYKDSVIFISLFYSFGNNEDIDKARKLINAKEYHWVHGIATEYINSEFLMSGCDDGILFNSDGSILKVHKTNEDYFYLDKFLANRFRKKQVIKKRSPSKIIGVGTMEKIYNSPKKTTKQ